MIKFTGTPASFTTKTGRHDIAEILLKVAIKTINQSILGRWLLLTRKLLNKGFLLAKLKLSLRKIYGRHHDVVDRYGHK